MDWDLTFTSLFVILVTPIATEGFIYSIEGNLLPKPYVLIDALLIIIHTTVLSMESSGPQFPVIFCSTIIIYETIGILNIWKAEIILEREQRVEIQEVRHQVIDSFRAECEVCYQEFNETTRIPRILQSCGHSVCEQCANRLQANNRHITCPFCTLVTALNGNSLPRNYALLRAMSQ
uniref:RING-type domain-containing protein n=1 Tax=Caenorhabditis tropicalis TaxID=1561998 RepID=A0A1I7THZ6_9PELO